jgi:hypothetical protein
MSEPASKRRLLKRLLGSFLLGWVMGCPLDVAFQLFALGIRPDRIMFPGTGLLLGWLLVYVSWNGLGQVKLRGRGRTLAIAIPCGVALGAILGAAVYAPIRTSLDPRAAGRLHDEVSAIHQGEGVMLGVLAGALLGGLCGAGIHLWRGQCEGRKPTAPPDLPE